MPRGDTQPQNHPRKGSSIKVEPIRSRDAINDIKARLLARNRRDYCLFTVGINTAYRASELLSLTIGQVEHLQPGDVLDVKQKKTKRFRATTVNRAAVEAIRLWLAEHPAADDPQAPLFPSCRKEGALCVSAVCRMVKGWCEEAAISGHYGSHSLRKTWGFHQRKARDVPLPLLMSAYGHRSEAQTLAYLHIQEIELQEVFLGMEL